MRIVCGGIESISRQPAGAFYAAAAASIRILPGIPGFHAGKEKMFWNESNAI
jgi:hypothetical protein